MANKNQKYDVINCAETMQKLLKYQCADDYSGLDWNNPSWKYVIAYHYNKKANLLVIINYSDSIFDLYNAKQPNAAKLNAQMLKMDLAYLEKSAQDIKERIPVPQKTPVIHLHVPNINPFTKSHTFFVRNNELEELTHFSTPSFSHISSIYYLTRMAQYLRDFTHPVEDDEIQAYFEQNIYKNRVLKRINLAHSHNIFKDSQEHQQQIDSLTSPQSKQLFRELITFRAIYAERIERKEKYLGIIGLFGTYTAQQKYNAVDKFLANPHSTNLPKAALDGELGLLIKAYQNSLSATVSNNLSFAND